LSSRLINRDPKATFASPLITGSKRTATSLSRCWPSASKVTITFAPFDSAKVMPVCNAAPCPRLIG